MRPRLESERFPFLPVTLEVRGRSFNLEATVDTGFEGFLLVPASLLNRESADGRQRWLLADGSVVTTPLYACTLRLGALGSIEVMVAALGQETLIGRGIIDGYLLTFDHGRRVILEP